MNCNALTNGSGRILESASKRLVVEVVESLVEQAAEVVVLERVEGVDGYILCEAVVVVVVAVLSGHDERGERKGDSRLVGEGREDELEVGWW